MESLSDLLGAHPITCGHPSSGMSFFLRRGCDIPSDSRCPVTEGQDFDYIVSFLGITPGDATSIKICSACRNSALSTVIVKAAERDRAVAARANEVEDLREKLEEVRGGGVYYRCPSCEELREEDDLVEVRQCPHCETEFDGTDNGRNCPDCNRPFSRHLADKGCPDCLEEEECEQVTEDDLLRMIVEEEAK